MAPMPRKTELEKPKTTDNAAEEKAARATEDLEAVMEVMAAVATEDPEQVPEARAEIHRDFLPEQTEEHQPEEIRTHS